MGKDLTNSGLDRQNILNNQFAVMELQKAVSIKGVLFENEIIEIEIKNSKKC